MYENWRGHGDYQCFPRVSPLRWIPVPVRDVDLEAPQAPREGVRSRPATLPATASVAVDWRIVGWIAVLFVGTLIFSGLFGGSAAPVAAPRPVVAGPAESAASPAYTVLAGDTLWGIAQRVAPGQDPRETVSEIRTLNGLANGQVLGVGDVLLLPSPAPR